MNKIQFKKLVKLYEEIRSIESGIYNKDYIDGNSVFFEALRDAFDDLYAEFESVNKDFPTLLDMYSNIVFDNLEYFDFSLLSEKEIKLLTKTINGEDVISIMHNDRKKFPNAIIKFKDKEEVINFLCKKYIEQK